MYNTISCNAGRETQMLPGRMEFLVDGAGDLPMLPTGSAPGSIAYTASMEDMWQKDNTGVWRKIGGDA